MAELWRAGSYRMTLRALPLGMLSHLIFMASDELMSMRTEKMAPKTVRDRFVVTMVKTLPGELVLVPLHNLSFYMYATNASSVAAAASMFWQTHGAYGLLCGMTTTTLRTALTCVGLAYIEQLMADLNPQQ